MMKTKRKDRIDDLVVLLDRLTLLHAELLGSVQDKLQQMRAGSIEGMQSGAQREQALVARIAEQEGLRKQLMDVIGRGLGAAGQRARSWTVSELADRLLEPQRGALLNAARRLRESIAEVARANRMAGLVAQEVLRHFRHIFAAIAGACPTQPAGYSPRGDVVAVINRTLFDAVA
ncbi:MAG TPA: flagellar export chaperone FlgN [Phycisphaerae bacterium]|jgi:hypothetical protein